MDPIDQLKACVAAIYSGQSFTETVTLKPQDGAERTVSASVQRRDIITARQPGQADTTTIAIQVADLPVPLVPYDKIETADGTTWTVQPGAVRQAEQWVYPVTSAHRMDGRSGS